MESSGAVARVMELTGSRRVRIAALGFGLGAALIGLLLSLRRHRPSRKTEAPRRAGPGRSSARHRQFASRGRLSSVQRQLDPVPQERINPTPESLVCSGIDSLSEVVHNWERALESECQGKLLTDRELHESLQDALMRCKEVKAAISSLVERHGMEFGAVGADTISITSTALPSTSMAMFPHEGFGHRHRTLSVLSDDSFVSALEELIPAFDDVDILNREELDLDPACLRLYQEATRVADSVQCRVCRSDFLCCGSDEEFLAKLHCVRRALAVITADTEKRGWLMGSGRELIAALLERAGKETESFHRAYDSMLEYLHGDGVLAEVEEELKARRVPQAGFYDVVLDFILMDAFDDLASPPSAVFAVTQNRFLSSSFKEATLRTVVNSVLKSKRARLARPEGFIAHFYDISEQVSPTLAWGFLGSDESLRELCYYFKDQICALMTDMFSFRRVRYTSLLDLSEDIWFIIKTRFAHVLEKLTAQPQEMED